MKESQNNLTKQIGRAYVRFTNELKTKELIPNKKQQSKYNYSKNFFLKFSKENKGKLVANQKHSLTGDLSFTTTVLDLTGASLHKFINSLKFASCVTFDATTDGNICVSLTIPDVNKIKGE